jgi:tetratricopeptide (TPR) repeat protein
MTKKPSESDRPADVDIDSATQRNPLSISSTNQYTGDASKRVAQIAGLLEKNPENPEIYKMLKDLWALKAELRPGIRGLVQKVAQKGSKLAVVLLKELPEDVSALLADADDAYYAAEYDRAIQIYRQILILNPAHTRALDYLARAKSEQGSEKFQTSLPRSAIQLYRRARDLIIDREFVTAEHLLRNAIIEATQANVEGFPQAEEALTNLQNTSTAITYRRQVVDALQHNKFKRVLSIGGNHFQTVLTFLIGIVKDIQNKLAGNPTTDAPLPEKKKDPKGK